MHSIHKIHPTGSADRDYDLSVDHLFLSLAVHTAVFNTRHLLGSYHRLKPNVLAVRTAPDHAISIRRIEGQ